MILPERLDAGRKPVWSGRAIAIERCLLFESHVIPSSVLARA